MPIFQISRKPNLSHILPSACSVTLTMYNHDNDVCNELYTVDGYFLCELTDGYSYYMS